MIGNAEPVSGMLPVVHSAALTSSVVAVPVVGAESAGYRSFTLYIGIAAVSVTFAYALSRKRQAN